MKEGDKRLNDSFIKFDIITKINYIDLSHIKRIRKNCERLEILLATKEAIDSLPFDKKGELYELFGEEEELNNNVVEVCVKPIS